MIRFLQALRGTESAETLARIAANLRSAAAEIEWADPRLGESLEDVANLIEHGHRMPRGASTSYTPSGGGLSPMKG